MNDNYAIHLTDIGRKIAEGTHERYMTFQELLVGLGADEDIAAGMPVRWSTR